MRDYIKELRANKEATQTEVAEALNISQNYFSVIENGARKNTLDLRLLVRMAKYFNVDLHWLIKQELDFINKKGA